MSIYARTGKIRWTTSETPMNSSIFHHVNEQSSVYQHNKDISYAFAEISFQNYFHTFHKCNDAFSSTTFKVTEEPYISIKNVAAVVSVNITSEGQNLTFQLAGTLITRSKLRPNAQGVNVNMTYIYFDFKVHQV